MTYWNSVLLKTPVLKYFYMLMTQKYIKLFVIIMINRTAVCTESDEKWSDEWLLKLNIDKRKSVSYCIKHPVKPVSDMTYNVFSGTLNPTQSINYKTSYKHCLPYYRYGQKSVNLSRESNIHG